MPEFASSYSQWYFKNGEQVSGPHQLAELKYMVAQGVITAATQVRQGKNGEWYPASQMSGLIPPPVPPNFNADQAGQFAGQAYVAAKTFAEDATWKTGLFRLTQLLAIVFEAVFLLYGFSCLMSNTEIQSTAMMEFSPAAKFGMITLFGSLINTAMCIAVLEIAISTGKMVDYLRK